jgi:hypothetical protein
MTSLRLLKLKAEEDLYDLFLWEEGEFRFLDDELPDKEMIPLADRCHQRGDGGHPAASTSGAARCRSSPTSSVVSHPDRKGRSGRNA